MPHAMPIHLGLGFAVDGARQYGGTNSTVSSRCSSNVRHVRYSSVRYVRYSSVRYVRYSSVRYVRYSRHGCEPPTLEVVSVACFVQRR